MSLKDLDTPSRSQRRREALEVADLAKHLVDLSPKLVQKLPLAPEIIQQILITQKLDRAALKRQLRYLAKLLRREDLEPTRKAVFF